MKEFFGKLLMGNSNVSSKRFITLIAFLLMALGFISNLFWDVTIEEFIYDSMKWIVIGGLGFTASEQFISRNKTTSTTLTPRKDIDIKQKLKKGGDNDDDDFTGDDDYDDYNDNDNSDEVDLKIR